MGLAFRPDPKPATEGGISRPKPQRRIDLDEVRRLYNEGLSQPEIGRVLGFNSATVCRAMQRMGLKARESRDYYDTIPDPETVVELYAVEGMAIIPIAGRLGCSTATVQRILAESGVKTRRPGRPDGIPKNAPPRFETVVKRMRAVIAERSGGNCEVRATVGCGGRATILHHRKLRAQGGDNTEANLLHVCRVCHGKIHQHPAVSYEMGWLVRSTDDPERVSVRRLGVTYEARP